MAQRMAPRGTQIVVPRLVPPLYPLPTPRVWFAREDGPTRRERIREIRGTRPPPMPALSQSEHRDLGISNMHGEQANISAREYAAECDPQVIDAIAELIADAIWLDVYGVK